jgi:hypothetical protein
MVFVAQYVQEGPMDKSTHTEKPDKCPRCKSLRVATILYGMPASLKIEKEVDEGRVVLGGCCVTDNSPAWKCLECQALLYQGRENCDDMLPKAEFLRNEFWILSWAGSVQRALRYAKNVSEAERREFRESIIRFCNEEIIPCYKKTTLEDKHIENIVRIRDYATQQDRGLLLAKPYNIGIAQKLLNLQLKYLWCAGYIERPPHCPVDRIILSKTRLKDKMNWTQITTIDEYMKVISAIRDSAGSQHIADWEIEAFNRRS